MTDADRLRILAESRALLENAPAAYEPPAEPLLVRKRHDPAPEPERPRLTDYQRRQQRESETMQQWEQWLQARLTTALTEERAAICEIIAESLAEVVGRAIEKERGHFYEQVRELKTETVRLETALEHLRGLLELEKSRALDLPALPHRREFN